MNILLSYFGFLVSLFLDGSTSGPIVESFSSSTRLFGRTSDVVDSADSDGEDSYACSRCSGCTQPTIPHTEIVAPSSDRSQPFQLLIIERKRQGIFVLVLHM